MEEAMSEKALDIWVRISQQIGELNASVKTVLDKLANHEQRLCAIEKTGGPSGLSSGQLVKWLVFALIGSISVIATLTGSAGLLKTLLGGMGGN